MGLDTSPLLPDSDSDGLSDGDEIELGTDPNNPDTDGDGILDGAEGTLDSDGDGVLDIFDDTDDRGDIVVVEPPVEPNESGWSCALATADGVGPWALLCLALVFPLCRRRRTGPERLH